MFLSKYKLPLLVVFLILLVAASYLLLTQNASKVKPAITKRPPQVSVSPTEPPLTSQNTDEQLGQIDTVLGGALNQLDADTSALDQIDASQDLVTF